MRWLALIAAIGCGGGRDARPTSHEPVTPPSATVASTRVEHDGISFELDHRIGHDARAVVFSPCPLASPTDKPDGVAPAHVTFWIGEQPMSDPATGRRIPGWHDARDKCTVPDFSRAGLHVFDAAEWPSTLKGSAKELDALRQLLAARALAPGQAMPFVPFVDASFAIVERVTFLDFSGGSGVLFLGELSIEPDALGRDLVFVFQGLTGDGKRYVLGLFPATTTLSIPAFPIDASATIQALEAKWKPYRADVARQIGAAVDDQFAPSPAWLRSTLESLTIQ